MTESFSKLLDQVESHEIQLPDFQRGWVWDGDRIKALLASLTKGYPIGAIMLLESGGDFHFECRNIKDSGNEKIEPKEMILYVKETNNDTPKPSEFPSYYTDKADRIGTWFKVTKFENADSDIISKCSVLSSGTSLSEASKHSMSPYFMIHVAETNEYNRELVK